LVHFLGLLLQQLALIFITLELLGGLEIAEEAILQSVLILIIAVNELVVFDIILIDLAIVPAQFELVAIDFVVVLWNSHTTLLVLRNRKEFRLAIVLLGHLVVEGGCNALQNERVFVLAGGYLLWLYIDLERALQEEGDIVKHKSEHEASHLMLAEEIVDLVAFERQFGLLYELFRLFVMR